MSSEDEPSLIEEEVIDDSDYFYRRIPSVRFRDGKVAEPNVKQRHVKLREGEEGLSGNLASQATPQDVLSRAVLANSAVARARVGDIRALGLDLVKVEDEGNPGHYELRPTSPSADFSDDDFRDKLAGIFKFFEY